MMTWCVFATRSSRSDVSQVAGGAVLAGVGLVAVVVVVEAGDRADAVMSPLTR